MKAKPETRDHIDRIALRNLLDLSIKRRSPQLRLIHSYIQDLEANDSLMSVSSMKMKDSKAATENLKTHGFSKQTFQPKMTKKKLMNQASDEEEEYILDTVKTALNDLKKEIKTMRNSKASNLSIDVQNVNNQQCFDLKIKNPIFGEKNLLLLKPQSLKVVKTLSMHRMFSLNQKSRDISRDTVKKGFRLLDHVSFNKNETIISVKRRIISNFKSLGSIVGWNLGIKDENGEFMRDKSLIGDCGIAFEDIKMSLKLDLFDPLQISFGSHLFKMIKNRENDDKLIAHSRLLLNLNISDFKTTLLHHAISNGVSIDFIRYIVSRGLNVDVRNCNSDTPIVTCIKENRIDILRYLAKIYPENLTSSTKENLYPIQYAIIYMKEIDVCRLLFIYKKLNLTVVANKFNGLSLLETACIMKLSRVVCELLQCKADIPYETLWEAFVLSQKYQDRRTTIAIILHIVYLVDLDPLLKIEFIDRAITLAFTSSRVIYKDLQEIIKRLLARGILCNITLIIILKI
ncbi:MAG: hypothetical protein MHMPM18_000090 [Marteilia pararefringens]